MPACQPGLQMLLHEPVERRVPGLAMAVLEIQPDHPETERPQARGLAMGGANQPAQSSIRKLRSCSPRLGCRSFRSALASICRLRYDELLRQASARVAEEQRQQLLSGAERLLLEDYPIVPLYFLVSKHLVSPRVQGYLPDAMDRHSSRFLALK